MLLPTTQNNLNINLSYLLPTICVSALNCFILYECCMSGFWWWSTSVCSGCLERGMLYWTELCWIPYKRLYFAEMDALVLTHISSDLSVNCLIHCFDPTWPSPRGNSGGKRVNMDMVLLGCHLLTPIIIDVCR